MRKTRKKKGKEDSQVNKLLLFYKQRNGCTEQNIGLKKEKMLMGFVSIGIASLNIREVNKISFKFTSDGDDLKNNYAYMGFKLMTPLLCSNCSKHSIRWKTQELKHTLKIFTLKYFEIKSNQFSPCPITFAPLSVLF